MRRFLLLLILFALPALAQQAKPTTFEAFEGDGFGEWKLEGQAFGEAPSHGGPGDLAGKATGYAGNAFACSYHGGDAQIGTLLSPAFTIKHDHLLFSDQAKITFPIATKSNQAGDPLVASEEIKGLTIPEGVIAKVFADHKEHQITSPTAICFDDEGRLLVAETHRFRFGVEDNRNHLYWLHDDLAAQTVEDRQALHEKWDHKVSMKSLSEATEVVRLVTGSKETGRAVRSQVYAEDFNEVIDGPAAGIFHHEGTTYLACIPHIWILRDKDHDGIAEERSSLRDGFGVRVSFSGHDLNGFALGPDGRIYGTIGDRGLSLTTKEGRRYSYPNQGSVFRFEPDGSDFEVVHTGLRNPKEIAFDKWGNGISVDNNSDQGDKSRIVYLMEGADSGWSMGHQVLHSFHSTIGIPERPQNQWMDERMWEPRNPEQPAWILPPVSNLTSGPSGLAYHPGTGFSVACKDRFLICDYKGAAASSGIWSFSVAPDGAGMKVTAADKFNWGTAVTDVEFGYDGRVYVSDFMGGWKSHQDGRIYTLEAEEEDLPLASNVQPLIREGFRNRSTDELIRLMDHPDLRIRTRAHIALAENEGALEALSSVAKTSASPLHRLHATWGLWKVARTRKSPESTAPLLELLRDRDAEIRAQAARALGEAALSDPTPLRETLTDHSLRVRSFAALSLARQKDSGAWSHILTLLEQNADNDAYLRHAGIMALIGCGDPEKISALKSDPRPAVRLAAVVALRRLAHPGLIAFLNDPKEHIADEALRAIHDLPLEEGRPNLARLLDAYAPGQQGRTLSRLQMRRLLHSAFRFGTPESARRLLLVSQNDAIDIKERQEALRLLSLWTDPPSVDQSIGRFMPLPPRSAADISDALTQELPKLLTHHDNLLAQAISLTQQYDLAAPCFDNKTIESLLATTKHNREVRSAALALLTHRQPENLSDLLTAVATKGNDAVSIEALEQLVKMDPEKGFPALDHARKEGSLEAKRKTWQIIGQLKGLKASKSILQGLAQLQEGKIPPNLQLEVIEAAEARKEPEVIAALAHYWESLPKEDPLSPWLSTFEGGDPSRGRKLYQSHPAAQCARCHRSTPGQSEGEFAGPNLAGIGKLRTPRHFVESLIEPSAQIAPGFGLATVTFKNGESLTGNLMGKSEETLDLSVGTDFWRISKEDIANCSAPLSAMPPMGPLLTKREMRDITAWLVSLKRAPEGPKSPPTPKPYSPAKMEKIDPAEEATPKATERKTPITKTPEEKEDPHPEAAPAPSNPKEDEPETSVVPPRENPTSMKTVVGSLIVLAWIGLCTLPVLFGLKNR